VHALTHVPLRQQHMTALQLLLLLPLLWPQLPCQHVLHSTAEPQTPQLVLQGTQQQQQQQQLASSLVLLWVL
jgi:hypothetical protein